MDSKNTKLANIIQNHFENNSLVPSGDIEWVLLNFSNFLYEGKAYRAIPSKFYNEQNSISLYKSWSKTTYGLGNFLELEQALGNVNEEDSIVILSGQIKGFDVQSCINFLKEKNFDFFKKMSIIEDEILFIEGTVLNVKTTDLESAIHDWD